MPFERLAAWIHDNELRAALRRLLEKRSSNGVILDRVRTDDDNHVGVLALVEGRRDGG